MTVGCHWVEQLHLKVSTPLKNLIVLVQVNSNFVKTKPSTDSDPKPGMGNSVTPQTSCPSSRFVPTFLGQWAVLEEQQEKLILWHFSPTLVSGSAAEWVTAHTAEWKEALLPGSVSTIWGRVVDPSLDAFVSSVGGIGRLWHRRWRKHLLCFFATLTQRGLVAETHEAFFPARLFSEEECGALIGRCPFKRGWKGFRRPADPSKCQCTLVGRFFLLEAWTATPSHPRPTRRRLLEAQRMNSTRNRSNRQNNTDILKRSRINIWTSAAPEGDWRLEESVHYHFYVPQLSAEEMRAGAGLSRRSYSHL